MKALKKESKQSRGSLLMKIIEKGDRAEMRGLFSFDSTDTDKEVLVRFSIWARYFFPQYFKFKDAPFHRDIDSNNLKVYRGELQSFVNVCFRGAAKTTRTKLFIAFVIANDRDHKRKYFKVLTKDSSNAKQTVTDIYNMFITPRVAYFYPDIFQKTVEKREETMSAFSTATGVKVRAGTVGTDQRGDIQEDARPDFIFLDDFETRKTLRSAVETQAIYDNIQEAITGLSKDGGAVYTCNYISERGTVHRLVQDAPGKAVMIVPIKFNNKPMWDAYTMDEIENILANADDPAGEYLCEPSAGADVFFEREKIDAQPKREPIRDIAGFKIFHNYDPSHRYGSGHDVSGGVGLDHSTSVFIDFSTTPNRVVATFKSNVTRPDTFGDEIASEGDRYGGCIVAVESNNHGHATLGRLKQIYDNLYFTEQKETRAGLPPRTKMYGWNTNASSKPKALFAFKKAVEDGHLELSDPDLIAESRSYSRDDLMDKEEDPRLTTRHFDLLMAGAIAYQMKDWAEVSKPATGGYQQPAYTRSGLDD